MCVKCAIDGVILWIVFWIIAGLFVLIFLLIILKDILKMEFISYKIKLCVCRDISDIIYLQRQFLNLTNKNQINMEQQTQVINDSRLCMDICKIIGWDLQIKEPRFDILGVPVTRANVIKTFVSWVILRLAAYFIFQY